MLARPCSVCGTSYTPKGHCGRESLYCSNACKVRAWKMARGRPAGRTRQEMEIQRKAREAAAAERAQSREDQRKLKEAADRAIEARRQTPCETCSGPVGKYRRSYCSAGCHRESPQFKAAKAAAKAMRRGAGSRTAFDPIEVLERDGWLCRLCGVPTPRAKRGTYDADAPELDHIVPISKGGPHTKDNTQCACRACNLSKADTLPTDYVCRAGQPRSAVIQAAAS